MFGISTHLHYCHAALDPRSKPTKKNAPTATRDHHLVFSVTDIVTLILLDIASYYIVIDIGLAYCDDSDRPGIAIGIGRNVTSGWCPETYRNETINVSFLAHNR